MEVLKKIMEGSLTEDQRLRGKALLSAKYPPYNVERERLNNADKYFGQRVLSLEKAQAEAYNSSQMPPNPEIKGKLYKTNAYASPYVASLRGKLNLAQQTTTAVEFARAQTQRGAQSSAGAVIFTPDFLKNNYFGTKEVVLEFNQMMNYISNYAQLLITDAQNLDVLRQGIMTPIVQLLDQVITSYGNFWNTLPDYNNNEQKIVREAVKKLVKKCWTVFSVQRQLILDNEFRPMTDADIDTYQRLNNVDQDILDNYPRAMPQALPLPPVPTQTGPAEIEPAIPAPQPAPIPQPPVPRASNIKEVDDAILAQFNPPQNLRNTAGQTISNKDYFLLVGLKWTEREEEFLVRNQIPQVEQDIGTRKTDIETQEANLQQLRDTGVQRGQKRLRDQIAQMKTELKPIEEQLKELTKRKVQLFTAQELLQEYLREVAKLPVDAEGNIDEAEIRKVEANDLRTLANNEDAFKNAVGLVGFGLSGGQIYRQADHADHIPIHTSEFEMKRRMADRARGDPKVVMRDQLIPFRQAIFPAESEFNPSWELLKRGYKANDTVMEPDRSMSDVMPTETGIYEGSGIVDDENATAFKQRFGLPFSQHAKRTDDRPIVPEHKLPFGGFYDIDGNDEFNTIKNFEELMKPVEHFKVEEEPDDILEHPDEFRRKIESYRFNTGRMKTKPTFMK